MLHCSKLTKLVLPARGTGCSAATHIQGSTGCEPSEPVITFLFWERSMPDPRDFRLRSVLWIVLATISVAAVLRYALHDYGGLLGEDIRTNALLGAGLLSAAVMATFFYRLHR